MAYSDKLSFDLGDKYIHDGTGIDDDCGNLDRILLKMYTTSCHDKMLRHGYICQYEGKYNA